MLARSMSLSAREAGHAPLPTTTGGGPETGVSARAARRLTDRHASRRGRVGAHRGLVASDERYSSCSLVRARLRGGSLGRATLIEARVCPGVWHLLAPGGGVAGSRRAMQSCSRAVVQSGQVLVVTPWLNGMAESQSGRGKDSGKIRSARSARVAAWPPAPRPKAIDRPKPRHVSLRGPPTSCSLCKLGSQWTALLLLVAMMMVLCRRLQQQA